jgi:ketosteroid isomerase-like protein
MTHDSHRALVERYLAAYNAYNAYNAFDADGMLALLDPAVEFENASGGTVTARASGLAEFRALAEQAAALFARREQRLTDYAEAGAVAQVGIAYEGVLAATLPSGLPPGLEPGATIRLVGRSTFHVRDGRLARIVDES